MKKHYFIYLISFFFLQTINAQGTDYLTGLSWPIHFLQNGNDLYIAENTANKIIKVDITAANPTPVTVADGLSGPMRMTLNGNTMYVSSWGGNIFKFDITASLPTTATNVVTGLTNLVGAVLIGNELYVTELNANKIFKIDITANNPTPVDVITTGLDKPAGMVRKGNFLYVSSFSGTNIYRIDHTISKPTAEVFISSTDLVGPTGLTIFGNDIYIADFNGGKYYKSDITAPTPSITPVLSGIGRPNATHFYNNKMYFIDSSAGKVKVIDLATLSTNDNSDLEILKLHPNPSLNAISLKNLDKPENYQLFNSIGKMIREGIINPNEKIDTSNLTSGMYILLLKNSKRIAKFIKE